MSRRVALIGAAILLLTLAALARQNGIVLLPFAGLALGLMARRNGQTMTRAALFAISTCLIVSLLTLAATAALAARVVAGRGAAKQVRLLELYDLEGALSANHALPLPDLQRKNPGLLRLMRGEGEKFYSPTRSDTLIHASRLQAALGGAPDDVLHRSWSGFVLHHPLSYLRDRAAVFRWVFLTPDLRFCLPYAVGLRGPPRAMQALGLKPRVSARDKLVDGYGKALLGTPLFSHLTFLLLATAELGVLLFRRRTADMVVIAMLAAAIAFAASFFFLSIACDYRYLYFLDLAALAALIHLALDPHVRSNVQRGIVIPALQRSGQEAAGATDSSA
jgi:hypothetical protein